MTKKRRHWPDKTNLSKNTIIVGEGFFLKQRLKISTERISMFAAISVEILVTDDRAEGTCSGCVLSSPDSCLSAYSVHSSEVLGSCFKPFLFLTFLYCDDPI